MKEERPLGVKFYQASSGQEPVREWLKGLSIEDKKLIGEDIKTGQFGWPLGMPLVKKMEKDIWEIRTRLKDRISRVLLTKHGSNLVLLHGFIKKTQKTPSKDLDLARKRLKQIKET
jgi:phage-related protein